MTLTRKALALTLVLSFSLAQAQTVKASPALLPVTLALDWTPNVNHIGIYVAQQQGWYKAAGVQLSILPYASTSPEVLVTAGRADVGISGAESVTASAASPNPVISIAAILAKNTAAFAVLKSSGITRPKQLDNKIYAAFGAPYETPIIQRLIRKDGGQGQFKSPVLSAGGMPALLAKRADFMWIFEGTEGVEARLAGTPLQTFSLTAYGVPDYYTPVLVADPARLSSNTPKLRAFLAATARGYSYAEEHPKEAAALMLKAVPKGTFPDPKVLTEGAAWLSDHQAYSQPHKAWGQQTLKMWTDYPAFLLKAGAIQTPEGKAVQRLEFDKLFSNTLLPKAK